ncbi:MAG: hypothetical protein SGPRY_006472 [Prymnesium sp.]
MGEEEKAEAERVAEEREVVERLELGGPAELAGEGAAEVAMAAVVGVAGPTVEHGLASVTSLRMCVDPPEVSLAIRKAITRGLRGGELGVDRCGGCEIERLTLAAVALVEISKDGVADDVDAARLEVDATGQLDGDLVTRVHPPTVLRGERVYVEAPLSIAQTYEADLVIWKDHVAGDGDQVEVRVVVAREVTMEEVATMVEEREDEGMVAAQVAASRGEVLLEVSMVAESMEETEGGAMVEEDSVGERVVVEEVVEGKEAAARVAAARVGVAMGAAGKAVVARVAAGREEEELAAAETAAAG